MAYGQRKAPGVLGRATWIVLAVLCVTGCATREKYDIRIRDWVGQFSDDLARSWGPPVSSYKLKNGNDLVVYETNRVETHTSPTQISQAPGTVVGNVHSPGPTTVTGGQTITVQYRCRTHFEVDPAGRIVGYGFEGNACRSR
jgi:hypothetical protein